MTEQAQIQSIFQRQVHPFLQVGVAIVLNLVGVLLIKAFVDSTAGSDSRVVFWEFSFSILMAFIIFNSVFSIPYIKRAQYFRDSIFSFLALAVIGGVLSHYIGGIR